MAKKLENEKYLSLLTKPLLGGYATRSSYGILEAYFSE